MNNTTKALIVMLVMMSGSVSASCPGILEGGLLCRIREDTVNSAYNMLGFERVSSGESETWQLSEGGLMGFVMRAIEKNPQISDTSYPGINGLREKLIEYFLAPLFVVVLMWMGMMYIIQSDSPQGRAESKEKVKRLFMGMIAVVFSGMFFQMMLDLSAGLAHMALYLQPSWEAYDNMVFAISVLGPLGILIFSVVVLAAGISIAIRYLLVIILSTVFPVVVACYFIDVDIIKAIGRKFMGMTVMIVFTQFIMAMLLAFSLLAASSLPESEAGLDMIMVFLLTVVGFLLVGIAPFISLGLMSVAGSVASTAGGAVGVGGAVTTNPGVMAAGGAISAAGYGISSVDRGTRKMFGDFSGGISDISRGMSLSLSTVQRSITNYQVASSIRGVGKKTALDDAPTPEIAPNMGQTIPGTDRSYQGLWQQMATAEITENRYRANDPTLGKKLFDANVRRGAGPSFDSFNMLDPDMRRNNLRWTSGDGNPGGFFEKNIVTPMLLHNVWGTDKDGNLYPTEKGKEFVSRFEKKSDGSLDHSSRGGVTTVELKRTERGIPQTRRGWFLENEKSLGKLKESRKRGSEFEVLEELADESGGYIPEAPVRFGDTMLDKPIARDISTKNGNTFEVFAQEGEKGMTDVIVKPMGGRADSAKAYRVDGNPWSGLLKAEKRGEDPNRTMERMDIGLYRFPKHARTKTEMLTHISGIVKRETFVDYAIDKGVEIEKSAGWDEMIPTVGRSKKITKRDLEKFFGNRGKNDE